jgi:hypothetical protein
MHIFSESNKDPDGMMLTGNPEAFTIMGPPTLWAELTGNPEVATILG